MRELSDLSVRQIPLRKGLPDRCIHQIIPIPAKCIKPENCGDCENCSYDPENNKKCAGYTIAYSY